MDRGSVAARRPVLGDLLEEVDVRVEEEGETGGELVDLQSGGSCRLHIGESVGQGEGQLVGGRGSGLADVVARHRHRVEAGHFGRAVADDVCHQSQRRSGREHVLLLGLVLLQHVVLEGPAEVTTLGSGPLGGGHVHGEAHGCRRVDGHGGGGGTQVDTGEEVLGVGQGVDGDPAPAHLALGQRVVRVTAHQGGKVVGHRQTVAPGTEEVVETGVGVLGRSEPGEHAHGPEL
jgi:hypothetical protein